MFCDKCGTENEREAVYCSECGDTLQNNTGNAEVIAGGGFYGRDWKRKKVLAIASIPYHDIMIDNKYLYVIELPRYKWSLWGGLIGLGILTILGLILGWIAGDNYDKKRRNKFRSQWIDDDGNLLTGKFSDNLVCSIPLHGIASSVKIIEDKKIIIKVNGEDIILAQGKREVQRFYTYLKSYVL